MSLEEKLRKSINKPQPRKGPLWRGPEEDGITFSLLSRFLVCKERFRLLVVEGLKPADGFNHRIEYGQMWHQCEEAVASGEAWHVALKRHVSNLCRQYPTQQDQIQHWHEVCKVQFPIYMAYWKTSQMIEKAGGRYPEERKAILQEEVFAIPYDLPSGRTVILKGKFDRVDFVGTKSKGYISLMENKTKGDIDEQQLQRQLLFDLQTMMYMTALSQDTGIEQLEYLKTARYPIRSVLYNVVRRPLSGGKGSIVRSKGTQGSKCSRCKGTGMMQKTGRCIKCGGDGRVGGKPPESDGEFYGRLGKVIKEDPSYFFMRWNVDVTGENVKKFRRECLNPILESLCDWWGWLQELDGNDQWVNGGGRGTHWRHPFGVWNILDEGGSSELDQYLETGSEAGLTRTNNLFPELT